MSGGTLVLIVTIFFLSFIAFSMVEILWSLRRIRLGIEQNGLLLTAIDNKLDGFAGSKGKTDNVLDISEQRPAKGVAEQEADKQMKEINSLLGRLGTVLPKETYVTRRDNPSNRPR
jgi:hypothetical protein